MKQSCLFAAGLAVVALLGGAPTAHSGTMGNGAAQRNAASAQTATAPASPADRDLALAQRCQAQPELMTSKPCQNVKARHPEVFNEAPKTATPR